jgi:hypothetical protein
MKLAVHLLIYPSCPSFTLISTCAKWRPVLGSRLPCLYFFFPVSIAVSYGLIDIHILIGPFLGFAGSVFTSHMHYEPLSPVIPFWFSPHDTIVFNAATRIFGAFKTAASSLMNYYLELENNPPPPFTSNEVRFP